MATLRSKKKLAAVSRETPEGSRGSRGRNVLDPELTQDYISQVSEEIEGRVTKKLSQDFIETESRILGALSKLDEFLLNPQVRICSVAAHGTSRNSNSENRETHGDRSSNDPYPEVGYFPHHSGQFNSPEAETTSHTVTETYPHMVTGATEKLAITLTWWPEMEVQKRFVTILTRWQQLKKKFPTAPLLLRQANRRRHVPQVNLNSAVRIPLRQLRQTRFCLPSNNWRRTPIQPMSTILLVESRNCLSLSQRQCLRLTENQRNSNCFKIYSKRVWKSTISWRKKTK